MALAAGQGFVTNIGGFVFLPVTLPVNVGAACVIQTHLAASVAHVHGHDTETADVRAAIALCLLGNAATEVLKRVGINVGEKLALAMIKKLPASIIVRINQKVGFALLAKFGVKRASVTLAKGIPLVGGVVGGGIDAAATRAVGKFANDFFCEPPTKVK